MRGTDYHDNAGSFSLGNMSPSIFLMFEESKEGEHFSAFLSLCVRGFFSSLILLLTIIKILSLVFAASQMPMPDFQSDGASPVVLSSSHSASVVDHSRPLSAVHVQPLQRLQLPSERYNGPFNLRSPPRQYMVVATTRKLVDRVRIKEQFLVDGNKMYVFKCETKTMKWTTCRAASFLDELDRLLEQVPASLKAPRLQRSLFCMTQMQEHDDLNVFLERVLLYLQMHPQEEQSLRIVALLMKGFTLPSPQLQVDECYPSLSLDAPQLNTTYENADW